MIQAEIQEHEFPKTVRELQHMIDGIKKTHKELKAKNLKFSEMTEEEQILSDDTMVEQLLDSLEARRIGVKPRILKL